MDKKGYISRIREDLRNARKHSKTTIESIAKSFGITNKNLVKEFTELAIILNAREVAHDSSLSTYEKYLDIVALYQSQVNLSMRTSMSVLMQQYSTPAPISFLASSYILKSESLTGYKAFKNIVKGSTKGKVVGNAHLTNEKDDFPKYLEPSAGNGLLTIALPYHFTHVNELDDVRLANLKQQPFAKVSSWDALNPPMAYDRKFDGVITNPPFGSLSEPILFGKFKIKRLEHAMALNALRCMKDNGKAAIIIGGHTTWDEQGRVTAGNNRIFLNYLYHFYNVEDIILINGKKLYSRQGTSINTRLILIDGAKETPSGAAPLKNKLHSTVVNNHEELWERVSLKSYKNPVPIGRLFVYYGFRKLTRKAVKKPQLVVFFENANNNPTKSEEWVNRRIEIIHKREQSEEEKKDSFNNNRMFTEYGYFIEDKPYYGDIEKVLNQNYEADKHHVTKTERDAIRAKLRNAFKSYYRSHYEITEPYKSNVVPINIRAKAILIKQKQEKPFRKK
ncbi:hypothetical protein [Saccharicrinis sp. 156]|uniref:hypothetical protein n=1 Tax=Saccharicrinis sp. 156 TaxID=3417574 RepID=UPI003D33F3BA